MPSADKKWIERLSELSKAALPQQELADLYPEQQQAVERVVLGVQAQAVRHHRQAGKEETKFYKDANGDRISPRWRRRNGRHQQPHNVLVIDGERGSGKTTTLLKIKEILNALTLRGLPNQTDRDPGVVKLGFETLEIETTRRTALVQPIIIPSSMLEHEMPMEAVLAEIEDELLRRLDAEHGDSRRQKELQATLNELRDEVHVGWTFAHSQGQTALVNDALDFKDYARNRATYNIYAYQRIEAWHGFVDALLEVVNCELLVLVFDDTDLAPYGGDRILNDVRQYLAHPRVVTIIAADVGRLSREIARQRFSKNPDLIKALRVLDQAEPIDARAGRLFSLWSDTTDVVLAEIDKTLPPSRRHRLSIPDRSHLESLPKERTLTEIFVSQFVAHALAAKTHTEPERAAESLRLALEWWFATSEHSALFVDSVRGLVSFLDGVFYDQYRRTGDLFPRADHKPLPTLLLGYHKARDLRAAMKETDHIGEAILAEQMVSGWLADDTKQYMPGGTYSQSVCDYWLDVHIGGNQLDARGVEALSHWIPAHFARILPPERRNDLPEARYGIAGYYQRSFLPWSCLYVFQLRYLDSLMLEVSSESKYIYHPDLSKPFEEINRTDVLAFSRWNTVEKAIARGKARETVPFELLQDGIRYRDVTTTFMQHAWVFSHVKGDGISTWDALCVKIDSQLSRGHADIGDIWRDLAALGDIALSFSQFARDLIRNAAEAERQRHFLVVMWVLSAHLARLGNDFKAIHYPQTTLPIGISLSPSPGNRSQCRLKMLVNLAESVQDRSPRTFILHVWSLVPIARGLFWIGDGPLDDDTAVSVWTSVRKLMIAAADKLTQLRAPSEKPPLVQTMANIKVRAWGRPEGKDVYPTQPEDMLQPEDLLTWNFPDATFHLDAIAADLTDTAEWLKDQLAEFERLKTTIAADASLTEKVDLIARFLDIGRVPAGKIHEQLVGDKPA
ncbi:hypothetical protein [Azospirillum brasilense]|uniref:hypothetical protein n=1 Tax=Azospirillum brasilense TaxID=192 RepID=UPI001EDA461F|nr:hypothetical protein [Azospirillum brasilense]UKJ73459.1 hypothetical protein H1Q64_02250 [Azospirillum brasilense]